MWRNITVNKWSIVVTCTVIRDTMDSKMAANSKSVWRKLRHETSEDECRQVTEKDAQVWC